MTFRNIIIIGIIIVILEGIGGYFYLRYSSEEKLTPQIKDEPRQLLNIPTQSVTTENKNATITLETQSKIIHPGDSFTVNVILDTNSASTSASDLTLAYNPTYLKPVKNTDPFTPSKIFQKTVFNKLDNKIGVATISAIADFDSSFSGRGVLTTILFKALKSGNTQIETVFIPSETRDSNIVSETSDILGEVQNLQLSIK